MKDLNYTGCWYIIKMRLSDVVAVHLIRKCFNQNNLVQCLTGQQRTHRDGVKKEQILARVMRLTMRRIEGLQENRVKENLARAEKKSKK